MSNNKSIEENTLREIYHNMKKRCYLQSNTRYQKYGGRGINVCEEWNQSLNAFREWALNNGYQLGLSLERIDVNGNYEPSNCIWITKGKQQHNKTNTIYITYNNETHNLMEWAVITGINYHCLKSRYERGWETERILTQPKQKRT